jgi:hypothetical protein
MPDAAVVQWVRDKYEASSMMLNERSRRLWAAAEARSLGRGGIAAVIAATGMSSATVDKGLGELNAAESGDVTLPPDRVRQPGGGRKRARDEQPGLVKALECMVEPTARGDPEAPLRWTCKSTSHLATELQRQGFQVGPRTVAKELKAREFSLQANRKTREGESHPDRNAQFAHINEQVLRLQRRGQPVVSVDTKKKELVGDFKNGGREWRRRGEPETVRVHDFPERRSGAVVPYAGLGCAGLPNSCVATASLTTSGMTRWTSCDRFEAAGTASPKYSLTS